MALKLTKSYWNLISQNIGNHHILKEFSASFTIFFLLCAIQISAFAQEKFQIQGKIVESLSNDPVPYANVVILEVSTGNIIAGTTTDDNGFFNVETPVLEVYVELSFIGFHKKIIRDLKLENGIVRLGTIKLEQNTQNLKEVEISGEKSSIEFKLDKRVFNVGKDISSTGMSALDVLNRVPSVTVSVEGQVSLRGNAGVQILINGKPSVLTGQGSNALGTITAEMIDNVEVITNPSAKYAAEGTAGIINIVLKKEDKNGFNGSVSVNTGTPNNHSIGVSLSRRKDQFNLFTQMGVGYRSLPHYSNTENRNLTNRTYILSKGKELTNENFYNFILGTDYYINERNIITLSGNYSYEIEEQPSEAEFYFYNAKSENTTAYKRRETTDAINPKYQYNLQYEKKFKNNKEHYLQFSTQGSFFGKEQASTFDNIPLKGIESDPNQKTETDFHQRDYTFKLDYKNPLSKVFSIETGALYDINDVGNEYSVFNQSAGEWMVDSNLTNNFEFNQKVLGIYGTAAYEGIKWGLKAGLRAENTNLHTRLINTGLENNKNYTNLFPSAHTSYKISKSFSLQAGYSRRIYRPRLWDLNPFFNIRNNYNLRQGNPDLMPEFSDSYELTSIFIIKKISLNTSIYNLYTTKLIERVTLFENNVNTTIPINLGTKNQTGLEINGKYSVNKWLTINGDFNYGYFVRKGKYESQNFGFSGTQWFTRATARLKLKGEFDVEISGEYNSSFETLQGRVSGFAFADAGVRKKLWKGKFIVNLSARDLFASRIRETIVNQDRFYTYSFSQRGRFITLGLSYGIGKGEAMTYSGRRR